MLGDHRYSQTLGGRVVGRQLSFEHVRAGTRWLKSHPIFVFLGIGATVFGFVNGGYTITETMTKIVGVPECLTYAKVYRHATGLFDDNGTLWIEHPQQIQFRESHRDRTYIYLVNLTPREGRQSTMLVRLPACGGTAQWSYQNPQQWVDLYDVWR